MFVKEIASQQNELYKEVEALLNKSRTRKKLNLVAVEGERELFHALGAHNKLKKIIVKGDLSVFERFKTKLDNSHFNEIKEVNVFTDALFSKLAYRESTEDIIGIIEPTKLEIKSIKLPSNPIILVLEAIEKPGNLGAILRTADAANVDLVLLCNSLVDAYNPNVIRSSLGCVFTLPILNMSSEAALDWLTENQINIFATDLHTDTYYHMANFTKPLAIVMGTESTGITNTWRNKNTHNIKVPMLGIADSLNVSTSTAIVLFECLRQRNFNQPNRQ